MTVSLRRFGALGFAVVLMASARAQTTASETAAPFTVDEAVQASIAGNPSLAAAARDIAAARSGVRAARALANPDIQITPAITDGGSDEELLVRQPLEVNGSRKARTGVAQAEERRVQSEAIVLMRDVVFNTRSAYYELARARDLLALARDLLHGAEELDRITRRQVEIGTRPGIEQAQTGIEVVRSRQQALQAEGRVTAAVTALNTLMGRSPGEAIGPLSPLAPGTEPVNVGSAEAAERQALEVRSEITAAEAARDALRQEARLERAQGRPDLAPQFRAGTLTRGVSDTGIGLGITLPLIDFGGRRNRVRQAEEGARAQEDRIAAAKGQVRQEVAQAFARISAADAVLKTYPHGVLDQAQRLLDASRVGFQAGQTSIVALLEAQRTYRAVQSEYTKALVERALASAELERAMGAVPADLLPRAGAQPREVRGPR